MTLAFCFGTRPEFLKLAPVVLEFRRRYSSAKIQLICSGQHQELLAGIDELFGITIDKNLDVRREVGATTNLSFLAEAVHSKFAESLDELKPNGVVVQGDAASTFLAALAAFHLQIPVYYVEAGLRTYDLSQPFPEEGYRQMIARIATFLFAPTVESKKNLIAEKIPSDKIFITGNTIVDAVEFIKKQLTNSRRDRLLRTHSPWLSTRSFQRLILITMHRRENQGSVMNKILNAVRTLAVQFQSNLFVFSVHPNPAVRLPVYKALNDIPNVRLIPPPSYLPFLSLMSRASVLITDSGGLQEEAPSFGIPVLVLRKKTERIEGVQQGWSVVGGTSETGIVRAFQRLESWKKPKGGNPYGDGKASQRIAKIIYEYLR